MALRTDLLHARRRFAAAAGSPVPEPGRRHLARRLHDRDRSGHRCNRHRCVDLRCSHCETRRVPGHRARPAGSTVDTDVGWPSRHTCDPGRPRAPQAQGASARAGSTQQAGTCHRLGPDGQQTTRARRSSASGQPPGRSGVDTPAYANGRARPDTPTGPCDISASSGRSSASCGHTSASCGCTPACGPTRRATASTGASAGLPADACADRSAPYAGGPLAARSRRDPLANRPLDPAPAVQRPPTLGRPPGRRASLIGTETARPEVR